MQHAIDSSPPPKKKGNALITVLVFTFLATSLVGSYLSLSINESRTVRIDIDRQKAEIAAEAGLDYGITMLREIIFDYRFNPSISKALLQAKMDEIDPPPSLDPFIYETPDGKTAFKIVVKNDPYEGTITQGSAFRGANGKIQEFTVFCGARNPDSGAFSVLRQDLQGIGLALIRFGVFYEKDLEILPGAEMVFEGPVHSNADMYVGGPLKFLDRITAYGNIMHRRKNDGSRLGEARAIDEDFVLRSFKNSDGTWIDSDNEDWMMESIKKWDGNIQSKDHGLFPLTPPINPVDEPYAIIERPLATNDAAYSKLTENEKFANKATLTLYVDKNGNLHATNALGNSVDASFTPAVLDTHAGKPIKDADGNYVMDTDGTHQISKKQFFDARENKWISPVDIYLDQIQANTNVYRELYNDYGEEEKTEGILYITREDPGDGSIPAIRIRNASVISNNLGMTIVSDLPVYIEGDFNVSTSKPALVAGDAVTVLSKNWQDANSTKGSNDRGAVDTEYYTVIMTGNTETEWGSYNGGLENVIRMLENWSNKTLYYRGSIIDLWYAKKATGDWVYGTGSDGRFRYNAPKRNWGYDTMYRWSSPPGMTHVFGIEETAWERTTWTATSW